jgi:hypothetical protein
MRPCLAGATHRRHVEEVESPEAPPLCERLSLAEIETLTPHDLAILVAAVPLRVIALTSRLSGREFTQQVRAALSPELHDGFEVVVSSQVRASEAFRALAHVTRTVCALAEAGALLGPVGTLELPRHGALGAGLPGVCQHRSG